MVKYRKWVHLQHNGVAFPPLYDYHGLHIKVKNNVLNLDPVQEEMIYAWAKKKGTQYYEDNVFISNFLIDFRKTLPKKFSKLKMEDLDLSYILRYQEKEKELASLPENKKKRSAERKHNREELKTKYGYTKIDGLLTEVANWMVEPPGLFIGRGGHPMRGRWKPRIQEEDVTLNLGKDDPIPKGKWKIVSDNTSMWLARWKDNLTDKEKYVWPHDSASLRQERDKIKYDSALKFSGKISKIRKHIRKGMMSKDNELKAIATVCYLIDNLAMRVGDEKDDDEADTVGASTLRIEHVKLNSDSIDFDFLGKDSVRWHKTLRFHKEDTVLLKNFKLFTKRKKKDQPLFTGINSKAVNRFLRKAMPNLTAKVFRTYHGTAEVKNYLRKNDTIRDSDPEFEKIYHARMANLQAAMLCNHKKTPPKNWDETFNRKKERFENLLAQKPKTEKANEKLKLRIAKQKLMIDLSSRTKDYNLNTSLKNYIDPRVYRAWGNHVGLDWRMIYTKALQRKMAWADKGRATWKTKDT